MKSFNQNRKESIKFSNMGEFEKTVKTVDSKGNLGKGMLAQIKEKESIKYPVIEETIRKNLESMFFSKARRPGSRVMTMYTGEEGMFNFDWALRFGEMIEVRNYRTKFKRIKGTYFSLFTKQGKYKLGVQGTTFTVYEGTKVIKIFTDVQSVELMNFSVFEKPEIHINKMKVINNYLKNLENGRK